MYHDLIDLVMQNHGSRGIYMGHLSGEALFASTRESLVVVGPPGSGKTSGAFAPSVASHPGPVVVTSIRQQGHEPGIREVTLQSRRAVAATHCGEHSPDLFLLELAVDERFGFQGIPVWWDFTEGCADWNIALRRAKSLARAGIRPSLENHHNWRNWCAELLAPLLFVAAHNGRDDRHVARVVANGPGAADVHTEDHPSIQQEAALLEALLAESPEVGGQASIGMLRKFCGYGTLPSETVESVFSIANSDILSFYAYDSLSDETQSFSLEDFLRSYGTLYITAGSGQAEDVRMIVASLVEAIEQTWIGIPANEKAPSLLLALDEVSVVAPVPSLPNAIGTFGGSGIQLLLGFQHSSQAEEAWGSAGRGVIDGGNHLMLFPGLDDSNLLKKIEELSPKSLQHDISVSARSDLRVGNREADASRLISERRELEAARSTGDVRVSRFEVANSARVLANERRRDGILMRAVNGLRPACTGPALLDEVLALTSVSPKEERRAMVEAGDVFSGRSDSVFLKSGPTIRFVEMIPWYRNDFWIGLMPQHD